MLPHTNGGGAPLDLLDLDDGGWAQLEHAYGSAADIPALLRQLRSFPPGRDYQSEPYFSLWSALCHQGEVYTASYATPGVTVARVWLTAPVGHLH